MKLLQIDFRFAGPWGPELTERCAPLARTIAGAPGLRWKIWTENRETGEAGGIYLFDDQATLDAYLAEHTLRLTNLGIPEINAKSFEVNEALSLMDRAPLT